jgi:uncharacterized protein YegL
MKHSKNKVVADYAGVLNCAGCRAKMRLEIGHVLFIDIVGYSKLLLKQQSELLRELNEVLVITSRKLKQLIATLSHIAISVVTFTSGKTNVGQALVLLAVFTLLIFCP